MSTGTIAFFAIIVFALMVIGLISTMLAFQNIGSASIQLTEGRKDGLPWQPALVPVEVRRRR